MSGRDSLDISIIHYVAVPEEDLRELRSALERLSPRLAIRSREPRPQAIVDITLPALVAIYMGLRIVDGFLEEIGAEGGRALKQAFATLFAKTKQRKIGRWLTVSEMREQLASQTEGKTPAPQLGRVAPMISIDVAIASRESIRFVFPFDLDEGELLKALSSIPSALPQAAQVRPGGIRGSIQLYDPERGIWVDAIAKLISEQMAIRSREVASGKKSSGKAKLRRKRPKTR